MRFLRIVTSLISAALAGASLALMIGVLIAIWQGSASGNLSQFVLEALLFTGAASGASLMAIFLLTRR